MERMVADLKPDNPRAEKLTGATIVKELPTQCLDPLKAHLHPLWKLMDEGDDLRLRPRTPCPTRSWTGP